MAQWPFTQNSLVPFACGQARHSLDPAHSSLRRFLPFSLLARKLKDRVTTWLFPDTQLAWFGRPGHQSRRLGKDLHLLVELLSQACRGAGECRHVWHWVWRQVSGLHDRHCQDTLVRAMGSCPFPLSQAILCLCLLMMQEAVWSGMVPRGLCVLVRRLTRELEWSQVMWIGDDLRWGGGGVRGTQASIHFFPLFLHAWHLPTWRTRSLPPRLGPLLGYPG